jgi:hypothetical protein
VRVWVAVAKSELARLSFVRVLSSFCVLLHRTLLAHRTRPRRPRAILNPFLLSLFLHPILAKKRQSSQPSQVWRFHRMMVFRTVQGVVMFVTVHSNAHHDVGFLTDTRRPNVAMTKAKAGAHLVGSRNTLAEPTLNSGKVEESRKTWRQLLHRCTDVELSESLARGCIKEVSLFCLLYGW